MSVASPVDVRLCLGRIRPSGEDVEQVGSASMRECGLALGDSRDSAPEVMKMYLRVWRRRACRPANERLDRRVVHSLHVPGLEIVLGARAPLRVSEGLHRLVCHWTEKISDR